MAVQIPEMLENGKTHKPEREKSGKWKRERERERNPSAWKEREKNGKKREKNVFRNKSFERKVAGIRQNSYAKLREETGEKCEFAKSECKISI